MGRIFWYCILSAAFLLLPHVTGSASPASGAQGLEATEKPAQVALPDSAWDLELLKRALMPLKEEKRERMDPRAPTGSPSPSKTEGGSDEGVVKGPNKHPPGRNAYWFRQGLEYSAKKAYDRAIAAFTFALTVDRMDANSFYNRAVILQRCGQYSAAVEDYTRAARIEPNDADLYYNRALAYQCSGNLKRAIDDYGRAIQLNPADPWPHWNRGIALSWEGRQDLAATDFCTSIDLAAASQLVHGPDGQTP